LSANRMVEINSAAHGLSHPLFEMEEGVLRKLYGLLNPRPVGIPGAAGATVPARPLYPILNREQTNLNCVLAKRILQTQSTGPVARLSCVICDEDVQNGNALFFAINNLTDASIQDLINMNPDALVLFNSDRKTPLIAAIEMNRSIAVLAHMIRANSAILTHQGQYRSPLICAIQHKRAADTIRILIDADQIVLRRRSVRRHWLPLCVALDVGCSLEVLQLLVYRGCLDVFESPPAFTYPSLDPKPNDRVPLHIAISSRCPSLENVRYLVNLNESALFLRNERGRTALHIAITSKKVQEINEDIVRFLVERGPEVRLLRCDCLHTPLGIAVSRYAKGIYPDKNFSKIASLLQVLVPDDDIILTLPSKKGDTPLLKACMYGMINPAILRVLIGKQAQTVLLSTHPTEQKTPLHFLVDSVRFRCSKINEQMELVRLLCNAPAALTMLDHCNNAPLHIAVENRMPLAILEMLCPDTCVRLLTIPNHMGNLPLHIAARKHAVKEVIVKLMGDNAQTCNVRNKENETALDIAMSESGIRMHRFSLFLHPSIDLKAKSREGNTVLHIALINGAHQKVIAHLVKLNPSILTVKNDNLNLPVMTALDLMTVDSKAKWPTKFIENLVERTHAVDAHAIPSCRSVLQTAGQHSRYHGTSVLEIALRRQRALSVIKCIVKADKDVLTSYSPAPSYSAATSRYYDANWHDARVRHRGTLLLPLHQAVWYCVHACVLQFLTEAHPGDNALECTDAFGNTALHMAIRQQKIDEDRNDHCDIMTHRKRNSTNMLTLQYLVKAGEMSFLIQDEQGNTPLHMAIQLDSHLDIIQLLLKKSTPPAIHCKKRKLREMPYEQVFVTQNVALCTPLELAARVRGYHMERIMQAYPQAMLVTGERGCSPMHTLLSHNFNDISPACIYSLLEMNPAVLLLLDDLRRTPLQVALESMLRERGRVTEASWLPIIRHLSGVSGNLLSPVKTMELMHISGQDLLLPYQFYHVHVRILEYEESCRVYSAPVVGLLLREAQDTGGTRDQAI